MIDAAVPTKPMPVLETKAQLHLFTFASVFRLMMFRILFKEVMRSGRHVQRRRLSRRRVQRVRNAQSSHPSSQ